MSDESPLIASVQILGSVRAVAHDGSFVDLPSVSQRRLLAILALHAPRRLRSEWLADVLGVTTGALRTSVSRARTTIGPAIGRSHSGYVLVVDVDADRFCRAVAEAATADDRVSALSAALDEWNGPALEEFSGEEWADGEIARLTEIHAGTVDDLAGSLVEALRAAEAVALLEGQIARHPYRDTSRGLMIRALAAAGRQADALQAFQRYRAVLVDEVGTEPSPDVVRIERRVATGWNGIESRDAASTADDAVVDLPLAPELVANPAFVGRADELAECNRRLARVMSSGLGSVVVEGEAGIGKTALLGAFARDLISSRRATVAYARCDESGPSLQALYSILVSCVEHAPSNVLAAHVARHGGELLRICPTLANRIRTTPAPTQSDEATERFLTFEAAADLLGRLSSARPLVVIIDDVHLAEPTTLLLLRHLARALVDKPLLFVLGVRGQGEADSEALRETYADLARGDSYRLKLDGLGVADLTNLLLATQYPREVDAPENVARVLADQTAGNPLFAFQLIRHWADAGFDSDSSPRTLRDVVWDRVRAVGKAAPDVLTGASVLGTEFDEDVLVAMLPLPETVVIDTLAAAAEAGLLSHGTATRRSLRFVHALVASTLYTGAEASSRSRLHEAAALALQQVRNEQPGISVQLARHFARAGRLGDAQQWWTRAGDDALEQLAPAEAAMHYRAALDLAIEGDRPASERADLLVRLGDALHRAGDPAAEETIAEGSRLATAAAAPQPLVRAVFAADRGFMRVDNGAPEYLSMIEHALAVADPADVATYARLRALLARSLLYTPDTARRLAAAHEALDLAAAQGDPVVLAQVAPAALYALWGPGQGEFRQRVAADAIRAAGAAGDPRLAFAAHQAAYNVAVESADPTIAARSLTAMRMIADAVPEPGLRWTLGIYETFDITMGGRLEEAEAIAVANLELGSQIASDAFTMFAAQLFVIGTFGGRHEELLPLIEHAARDNAGVTPFKLAYAIVCTATGHEEIARSILAEGVVNRFAEVAVDNLWLTTIVGYAVVAIELCDADAAGLLLPIIEPYADVVAFNGATSQGPVAAYAGKLASLVGRHDDAEEHLRNALETATAFGWNYHRATTLFALAAARHRRDGVLDAQCDAWLAEAANLCRKGGFRSWLVQVEALAAISPR